MVHIRLFFYPFFIFFFIAPSMGRAQGMEDSTLPDCALEITFNSEKKSVPLFIGNSQVVQTLKRRVALAAGEDLNILLIGETGTGKEILAQEIHARSNRRKEKMVAINLASLSETLMESELFGHKAGAFTGANTKEPKVGLLELVDGGTLFLDELSHLNPDLQAKLLRVLETGDFLPVGDVQHKHFKGRIIAAINTDPETAIRNAKLNKDLYYRLAGIPIRIPALRDRKTDIPLLVNYFLKLYSKGTEKILEPEAMDKLISLPWSGNVRELSYFVGRLPLFAEGSNFITKADVEEEIFQGGILATEDSAALTLEITQGGSSESHIARLKNALVQVRREIIVQSLTQAQGNVERAAQIYGVSRRSFTDYLKKFEIKPKDFKSLPSNRVAIPLD